MTIHKDLLTYSNIKLQQMTGLKELNSRIELLKAASKQLEQMYGKTATNRHLSQNELLMLLTDCQQEQYKKRRCLRMHERDMTPDLWASGSAIRYSPGLKPTDALDRLIVYDDECFASAFKLERQVAKLA